jgi:parvulin-like peptidyl-prolyl isomerase
MSPLSRAPLCLALALAVLPAAAQQQQRPASGQAPSAQQQQRPPSGQAPSAQQQQRPPSGQAPSAQQPQRAAPSQGQPAGQGVAADTPLATVNGVPIPQGLFQHALQRAIQQGNPDTPQLRAAIRNQLIARELFIQEAAKQNLDKDPQVLAIAEEAKRNAMVQRLMRDQIQLTPVTEEQVKAHYEKVKATMGPKEYKMRVMLLPNEVRAKEMRDQLLKGKDFTELARQWSLAPSSASGGELDWISFKSPAKEGETNGLPLPIAQAVEKLQKGKVSAPLETQGRWWIVQLDDTRATKVPAYEQAKAGIQTMLSQRELERATGELFNRLAKSATIVQ